MPDINDRLIKAGDANIVSPQTTAQPAAHPPMATMEPTGSGFTRCPIPPIWSSNPDSLRQFYRSGIVPQLRIFSPPLKGTSN